MYELGLDVYLIPTDDPHMSKHVPMAYTRKAQLMGFNGLAGTELVRAYRNNKAFLWTDSR